MLRGIRRRFAVVRIVDAEISGWASDGLARPWTLLSSDRRPVHHHTALWRRRNAAHGAMDLRTITGHCYNKSVLSG